VSEPAPSPPPDQSPTLTCPRCGYDQAGQAARFTDSCPLSGLCTECGLTFAWADVYFPSRTVQNTFEHAYRGLPRAWVRTAVECVLTPRLFTRLRMHHPLHIGRLATYGAVLCVLPSLMYLLFALINDASDVTGRWLLVDFGWRGSRPLGAALNGAGVFERLAAVLVPLGDRWTSRHMARLLYPIDGFVCVALWLLFTPLCFPLLRQTLRRTRVRVAHFGRLGVYALTGAVAVIIAQVALDWLTTLLPLLNTGPLADMGARSRLSVWALGLWQLWFWSWAGSSYLRLPRALPVALGMTVIGGLLSLVVVTSIFGWRMLQSIAFF